MTTSRPAVDADGYIITVYDLYHRTRRESAQALLVGSTFVSRCQNQHEVYFTNRPEGSYSKDYGDVVVHVEVPTALAVEDEVFRDGEVFYRVRIEDLSRSRVVGEWRRQQ